MGREVTLFKSEEKKSRTEVGNFLKELADKISNGHVVFKQGTEEINLKLPEGVVLEIEVEDEEKSRGTRHSLEIELKWYDGEDHPDSGSVELGG